MSDYFVSDTQDNGMHFRFQNTAGDCYLLD